MLLPPTASRAGRRPPSDAAPWGDPLFLGFLFLLGLELLGLSLLRLGLLLLFGLELLGLLGLGFLGLLGLGLLGLLGLRLLHDLAFLDAPAPGARLLVAHLDERLEAHQVRLQSPPRHPEAGRGLLEQPLRLEVEDDLDPGKPVAQLVERYDARRLRPTQALPCDPLVRPLIGDLGLPLASDAPDLLVPDEV